MSCNCEGNTYHIGMGCCTPVVANADNYYTKSEVDEKIDEITISGGGITTGEVQSMIDASVNPIEGDITALNGQVEQLSTDMENKAEKSDIPSLEGYATQQWVEGKHYLTEHQSLENYYTKGEVDSIADAKLDATAYTPTDLSNYYNKPEVNNLLSNKANTSDLSALNTTVEQLSTSLENKANKSEIPSLAGYATEQWVEDKQYLTEHQHLKTINNISLVGDGNIEIGTGGTTDLSDYYTKEETNDLLSDKLDATAYTPTDLTGYATHQWVEDKHYLTEHQSLNGYATQEWVGNQGYLTEHQTLKTINNQTIVGEGNITITAETPDLSNYYTKTEADNTFAEQELLDIVNNRVNTHTGNTNIHVTATEKETWNNKVDSSTLNNYMLKTQIWCGTQAEYDAITEKDNEVIYLIHA